MSLDVRPDGAEFAVAGESGDVEVVDLATFERKLTLGNSRLVVASAKETPPPGHANRIFSVIYHPTDPNTLLTAGWDQTVMIWDTRHAEPIRYIPGAYICGDGLSMDPLAGLVLTGSYRQTKSLQIWDFATSKPVATLSNPLEESWIYCCKTPFHGPLIRPSRSAACHDAHLRCFVACRPVRSSQYVVDRGGWV